MGTKHNADALGAVKKTFRLPVDAGLTPESVIDFPARIVVVDDRRLCREGLRLLIQSLGSGLDVSEAKNTAGIAAVKGDDDKPIVAVYMLIDHSRSGLEGLRTLTETHPDVQAVVLCDGADRDLARAVMAAGAKAFLPSTTPSQVLVAVLRLVLAGGLYVPPPVLFEGAEGGTPQARGSVSREAREAAIRDAFHQLTARQRSVLALLSEGCTNRTVAEQLDMRENTVKAHVKQIMHKLRVDNRTQAALMADRLVTRAAL